MILFLYKGYRNNKDKIRGVVFMNVSAISSTSNYVYSALDMDDKIQTLKKQRSYLEDQIQQANNSNQDTKTIQEKVSQLQQQLQQIELQIEQNQTQKLNRYDKPIQQNPYPPATNLNSQANKSLNNATGGNGTNNSIDILL